MTFRFSVKENENGNTQLKLNADPNVMIHLKLFVYLFSNPFGERHFSNKAIDLFQLNFETNKNPFVLDRPRERGRGRERMVSLCFIIYLMCLNQHRIEDSDRIIRENEEDKSEKETETNTLRVVANKKNMFFFHSVFFCSSNHYRK